MIFLTWSQGEGKNAALIEDVYLLKDTTNKKKEKITIIIIIASFFVPSA